jgi:hypothetical protein
MADLVVFVSRVKRQAYYLQARLCQGIVRYIVCRRVNDPKLARQPIKMFSQKPRLSVVENDAYFLYLIKLSR